MKRRTVKLIAEGTGSLAGKVVGGKLAGPAGSLVGSRVGKAIGRKTLDAWESQNRREAAFKAWRTRRRRYGPRGHR